jgi:VanZ family protein
MLFNITSWIRSMRLFVSVFCAGLMIAMFWSSLQTSLAPPEDFGFDKFVHAGAFAFLALIASIIFERGHAWIACGVGLSAFGLTIEIAQSYVPGREASTADWASDTIGVLMGLAIGYSLRIVEKRRALRAS